MKKYSILFVGLILVTSTQFAFGFSKLCVQPKGWGLEICEGVTENFSMDDYDACINSICKRNLNRAAIKECIHRVNGGQKFSKESGCTEDLNEKISPFDPPETEFK